MLKEQTLSYTEHVIQRFEMTFVFLEYQSLLLRQACAPVLLDTPTAG